VTKAKERSRVDETPADKFAVAGGGKVKRAVLAEYTALQSHVKRVGGFEVAERVYAAPLDAEAVLLPKAMKVHNVEWVADGAARFVQQYGAPASRPFFLYVGWTLPHGPDADRSLRTDERVQRSMPFTPAGTWKSGRTTTAATRREVRRRATAIDAERFPAGHQGHRDYRLALAWLDRGVGTVLWALQRRGITHSTLLAFMSE
jgi:arylsulfatase A-like enzyme